MARKSYGKARTINNTYDFSVGDEEFSVPIPISDVLLIDLVGVDETDEREAARATKDFLKEALGADYTRLRKATNVVDFSDGAFTELMQDIVVASSEVPTRPQSVSSVGSQPTGTGSVESAPVTESLTPSAFH